MKKIMKSIHISLAILLSFTTIITMIQPISVVEAKTVVQLNTKSKTIYIGNSFQLKMTGTKNKVTWSSSNKAIATVNSSGKVTGKKAGKCTITAKVSGKKYTCTVTVKNKPKMNVSSKTLEVNKSYTLKVTNAIGKVTWSTSNKNVAIVNSSGKVTAKKAGTAVIKAKTSGVTVSCQIKVVVPITGIQLNKTTLSLNKGSKTTLKATIKPTNTTSSKNVTWTTSNSKVATVDKSGTVTAIGAGTATMTAKSSNGKTATCQVKINIPITGIQLNKTTLSLNKGSKTTLKATIKPTNTTSSKNVTWTTSNSKVATVDKSGTVTAIGAGTATMTAKSSNGKTATCQVKVNIPIIGIQLDTTDLTLNKGSKTTLKATINPTNTTSSKNVTWATSNSKVATVDKSGTITAVGEGKATITVKTSNGKTATCQVTVIIPITDIQINKKNLELQLQSKEQLIVDINPKNATYKNVSWYSFNEKIASVDANGVVTAKSKGKAIIVASVYNGQHAYCNVEVVETVGVKLNKSSLTLNEGEKETLIATFTPVEAQNSYASWRSSNEKVATVDIWGEIRALKEGKTTITATSVHGITAKCEVTVVNPIIGVKLNKTDLKMIEGSQEKLTVTLLTTIDLSKVKSNKEVTWTSSQPNVVSVTNGTLKAMKPGNATITVMTANGKKATCQVTVDEAKLNTTEVTLYETIDYSDCDEETIQLVKENIPTDASHHTSFQFQVEGVDSSLVKWSILEEKYDFTPSNYKYIGKEYLTHKVREGYFYVGYPSSCSPNLMIEKNGNVSVRKMKANGLCDTGETVTFTLQAELENGKKLTAKIHIINEVDAFLDRKFNEFKDQYITDSMSEYEKMEKVAWYIQSEFGYSHNPNPIAMLIYGTGDCLASRILVRDYCARLGMKALYSSILTEGNDYHGITMVKADGIVYEVTTGYQEPKPRSYSINIIYSNEKLYNYIEDGGMNADYFGIEKTGYQDMNLVNVKQQFSMNMPSELTLKKGKSEVLAIQKPNGTYPTYHGVDDMSLWTTSDESVVKIMSNPEYNFCKIYTMNSGEADIEVTVNGIQYVWHITVE